MRPVPPLHVLLDMEGREALPSDFDPTHDGAFGVVIRNGGDPVLTAIQLRVLGAPWAGIHVELNGRQYCVVLYSTTQNAHPGEVLWMPPQG